MVEHTPPDILFITIKRKIEQFYDEYYFGNDNEDRKTAHIQLLEIYYDIGLFKDPLTMRQNLDTFLTKLHEMVCNIFDE
jgi:hypothetical protein